MIDLEYITDGAYAAKNMKNLRRLGDMSSPNNDQIPVPVESLANSQSQGFPCRRTEFLFLI